MAAMSSNILDNAMLLVNYDLKQYRSSFKVNSGTILIKRSFAPVNIFLNDFKIMFHYKNMPMQNTCIEIFFQL